MDLTDPFEKAIDQAHYYREICLEAARSPRYSFMEQELQRLADMWKRFAVQVELDARGIAESREFLSRIDEQFNTQSSRVSG